MSALAAASLACTCACAACLVYLHVAPTGYSPARNAVSEYGVGRFSRWYVAQAACAGIAAALLAAALADGVAPVPRRTVALLCVFALARFAIGRFPTDRVDAAERTATGRMHLLLAAIAFASVAWAASVLRRADHGQPALGLAAAGFIVAGAIALRTPELRRWFGLLERGFYVSMLAWLALVAVRLL